MRAQSELRLCMQCGESFIEMFSNAATQVAYCCQEHEHAHLHVIDATGNSGKRVFQGLIYVEEPKFARN